MLNRGKLSETLSEYIDGEIGECGIDPGIAKFNVPVLQGHTWFIFAEVNANGCLHSCLHS